MRQCEIVTRPSNNKETSGQKTSSPEGDMDNGGGVKHGCGGIQEGVIRHDETGKHDQEERNQNHKKRDRHELGMPNVFLLSEKNISDPHHYEN